MTLRSATCLLLLISLQLPCSGQSINITGRVIDRITGSPVAGATVGIAGQDGLPQALTGADGRFALSGTSAVSKPSPRSPDHPIAFRNAYFSMPVYLVRKPFALQAFKLDGSRTFSNSVILKPDGQEPATLLPGVENPPLAKTAGAGAASPTLRITKDKYLSNELPISTMSFDAGDIKLSPESFAWKSAKVLLWDKYNGKPATLVAEAQAAGLNMIQVMDRYFTKGNAANAQLVALANQKGIKVFVIFETFHNDDVSITSANSAKDVTGKVVKDSWLNFICPNEETYKTKRLLEIEKLVKDIRPDGISMDFFRFFVFWEGGNRIQTCFDDRCLKKFADQSGITAAPSAILADHLKEWTDFKCRTIMDYAARIHASVKTIKPDLMLNLHMVPWKNDEYGGALKSIAGQDLRGLSRYFDFIQPMSYSILLKKDIAWIQGIAADAKTQVGQEAAVIPCIQTPSASATNIGLISKPPINGYTIWPFEEL